MTIATDLATATAVDRRYFVRIDGLGDTTAGKPIYLWEPHARGDLTNFGSSTNLVCLEMSSDEWTTGLDLKTMKVTASDLVLGLANVDDPNDSTKKFWALQTASAPEVSGSSVVTSVLVRDDIDDETVAANASTIHAKNLSSFPTGGTKYAYLGAETISYTGITTTTDWASKTIGRMTGVTKGLWPAFGTGTFGQTYLLPKNSRLKGAAEAAGHTISTHPFSSLYGRRVGVYITTFDEENQQWRASGQLVWAGYIKNGIKYSGMGTWSFGCEHVLGMLESRQVATGLPTGKLKGINIQGDWGRRFVMREKNASGALVTTNVITLTKPTGTTNASLLAADLAAQLNAASWSATVSWNVPIGPTGEKISIEVSMSSPVDFFVSTWGPRDGTSGAAMDTPCHGLFALGFTDQQYNLDWNDAKKVKVATATSPPYSAYHPLHVKCNGAKLAMEHKGDFVEDQGDAATAATYVAINDVDPDGPTMSGPTERSIYVAQITALGTTAGSNSTLAAFDPDGFRYNIAAFAGTTSAKGLVVKQVFKPAVLDSPASSEVRGPFQQLCRALISTGTATYNDPASPSVTYDENHLLFSIGMQVDLVDVQSFIDADNAIKAYPRLYNRTQFVVQSGLKWSDWAAGDAALFNHAIAWVNGKITVQMIATARSHLRIVSLTEDNSGVLDDKVAVSLSASTVSNQMKLEAWNINSQKWEKPIPIDDVESQEGMMGLVAGTNVKSYGIHRASLAVDDAKLIAELERIFRNRAHMLRRPWPMVTLWVEHSLQNRIFVGDVVLYTDVQNFPNPRGTGLMSTGTDGIPATVKDVSWKYSSGWGTVTILVHAAAVPAPWAPGGLIDVTKNDGGYTGGYDAGPPVLVWLVNNAYGESGDTDDGAALAPDGGEGLLIVERAPSDPTSPQGWEVGTSSAFETDGANILALDAALTGFDTSKEYVVQPASHDLITAAQKLASLHQAEETTELLDASDVADRWG